ncbi:serine endoprotease DegQ [Chromatiales bacterium (ex Bugula neritina AB1)]|nr:serine endoprotease DegQ [Chromatiales bacterium (ex Bugula neritina AB1)]
MQDLKTLSLPLVTSRFVLSLVVYCVLSTGVQAAGLPGVVDGEPLPSLAPMLEKTTPAVVNIATRGSVTRRSDNPLYDDPFFRRFFNLPERSQRRQMESLGSGVIVDADAGLVVTNHHVIDNAREILVTLTDGREFDAEIIGQDPEADVAVIRIEAEDLVALQWADSDRLRVGDFVVAIGNPFGLGQTVTSGIVSALGRSGLGIEEIEDFIQTDASINPGNSGGALVNLRGDLIGINTAIVGPAGGNVGIGFAIPANMARGLMRQLVDEGEVRRGKLGISVQELDEELQQVFGVERGVVISGVEGGSSAELAGLRRGDVIVSIGERNVRRVSEVRNAIGLLDVGETVFVKFYRDRKLYESSVTVGEPDEVRIMGRKLAKHLTGAVFENAVSRRGRLYVRISKVERSSAMGDFGFEVDDIILSANRIDIETVQELKRAVAARAGETQFKVQRGNFAQTVTVR